jgi:hypothetical protein
LTFPTVGAQNFGSPPIVFFLSFSSTVELAPWGDFRLLTQLENNARASPRLTSPVRVRWGSGKERGTVVSTWKWIYPFVVLLDRVFTRNIIVYSIYILVYYSTSVHVLVHF